MTATAAPFGFRPANHPTGLDRGTKRTIASGYGTAIFKGAPVILNTNGTIVAGAAASDILGIFNGVEYIDALGKPNYSNFWPAGQLTLTGTAPVAYVWEDQGTVFEVQANGSVPQTALGDQTDVVNVGNGNAMIGLSTCGVSATLAGAAAQGQFRIVGFGGQLDNVAGDLFTVVQVQIARDQFIANKVAI